MRGCHTERPRWVPCELRRASARVEPARPVGAAHRHGASRANHASAGSASLGTPPSPATAAGPGLATPTRPEGSRVGRKVGRTMSCLRVQDGTPLWRGWSAQASHGAHRRSHAPLSVPPVNAHARDAMRCEPDGGKKHREPCARVAAWRSGVDGCVRGRLDDATGTRGAMSLRHAPNSKWV